MFVRLILITFFFHLGLTIRNHSSDICYNVNLCRSKNELCYPVVTKCRNSSCQFRRFYTIIDVAFFARWFYDTNDQRCRRSIHHIENFVYFRFLRDCKRICPIIREKQEEKMVTLHISETPLNYNDTVYVRLNIDISPIWMQKLVDHMNISNHAYQAETHYFQNYQRHFANFIDPTYQLMFNHQYYTRKKPN